MTYIVYYNGLPIDNNVYTWYGVLEYLKSLRRMTGGRSLAGKGIVIQQTWHR